MGIHCKVLASLGILPRGAWHLCSETVRERRESDYRGQRDNLEPRHSSLVGHSGSSRRAREWDVAVDSANLPIVRTRLNLKTCTGVVCIAVKIDTGE